MVDHHFPYIYIYSYHIIITITNYLLKVYTFSNTPTQERLYIHADMSRLESSQETVPLLRASQLGFYLIEICIHCFLSFWEEWKARSTAFLQNSFFLNIGSRVGRGYRQADVYSMPLSTDFSRQYFGALWNHVGVWIWRTKITPIYGDIVLDSLLWLSSYISWKGVFFLPLRSNMMSYLLPLTHSDSLHLSYTGTTTSLPCHLTQRQAKCCRLPELWIGWWLIA